ncbi:Nucleoside diphosphate kinase 7, partial [Pseudolycoriella hygida]
KMVQELVSGPSVGMEITSCDSQIEVLREFRNLCGPSDPEIAKQIRPKTIRAKFGTNHIQNAIHCTDLPDDV